jgi:tetratricopeptide (TPR) repeat protein
LAIVIVSLSSLAVRAQADEGDAKTQARAHFRAGTAFYEAGDYDRAIEQYRQAYELIPSPDLLFNLGQAYRLKGDMKSAANYYRLCLRQKSDGPVGDAAREHLQEVEAQLPPETATPPPDTPAPTADTPAPTPSPPATAKAATPTATSTVIAARPAARPRPLWKRPWLWALVGGVAVAGIVIGVGVGVGAAPHRIQPTDGSVRF